MYTRRVSVPEEYAGNRLDKVLAKMFNQFSRARLKRWIDDGQVLVDGEVLRPKDIVTGGENIEILEIKPEAHEIPWQAEDIPLDIVYVDADIIVINKQAGLVVHPAAGNWSGTLVNGLINFDEALKDIPRAGIVHRLDKDTTGLMVVARNLKAHTSLVRQLERRQVKREYQAIVLGVLTGGGTIDAPIGRHKTKRTKIAVVQDAREAVTHFRVLERFNHHTLIRVMLDTGRTHQIRVHMAYKKNPIIGDKLYGGRLRVPKGVSDKLKSALTTFERQALHAYKLGFEHPASGNQIEWKVDLPPDMKELKALLEEDAK